MQGLGGQATDIEIHAKQVIEDRRVLEQIYADRTGKSIEQIHDDMDRDRFFTAEQAVDYGLVDRIVESRELPSRPAGFGGRGL
jgi:ATP-dependent Clp protease protease subunit